MIPSNKTKKQLVRISAIIREVFNRLLNEDELSLIQNLINLDFCNESILRSIGSDCGVSTEKSIHKTWDSINAFLKENSQNGLTSLPNKSEILNLVHAKRNFIQHSGECPSLEEIGEYFEISEKFISRVTYDFFGIKIIEYSIIDLINSAEYKQLFKLAKEYADKSEYENAISILKIAFNNASGLLNHDKHQKMSDLVRRIDKTNSSELSQFKKIFEQIDNNFEILFKSLTGVVKGSLNIPDERFGSISPHAVDQTMGGSIRSQNWGESKLPSLEDFNYSLSYCVNLVCRLESLNLLERFDFERRKPFFDLT